MNDSSDVVVVPTLMGKTLVTRQVYDEQNNTYKIEIDGKEDIISYDADARKIQTKYYDIDQAKIFDNYQDVITDYERTRHVRIKEGRFMNFLINSDLG